MRWLLWIPVISIAVGVGWMIHTRPQPVAADSAKAEIAELRATVDRLSDRVRALEGATAAPPHATPAAAPDTGAYVQQAIAAHDKQLHDAPIERKLQQLFARVHADDHQAEQLRAICTTFEAQREAYMQIGNQNIVAEDEERFFAQQAEAKKQASIVLGNDDEFDPNDCNP